MVSYILPKNKNKYSFKYSWDFPILKGMFSLTLFITILQLICGLALLLIVLFQSGKSSGLSGSIGGVADTFLTKNKAKSIDAKLAKATKWVAGAFVALTMVLSII